MWKSEEELRREALKYAGEAFAVHRMQIYQAVEMICQCSKTARQSGLLALEECCENAEEKDIPLAALWKYAVLTMIDSSDLDMLKQTTAEQIRQGQYSGHQLYVAYLYFLGVLIIKENSPKPDTILNLYRTLVPEEAQEDYDHHFQSLREMWQKEKQEEDKANMEELFSGFADTKASFHKLFHQMGEEGLRCIMEELDYQTLEKALSCAEEELRDRFRKNAPEKMRQELSYRWWTEEEYWKYYGCGLIERQEAMKRMIYMAGGLWSGPSADEPELVF